MKTSFSILSALLAVLLFATTSSAAEKPGAPSRGSRLSKSVGEETAATVLCINNINQWMDKHALFPCDYSACKCASSEYPVGTAGMIYMDGFLYGAKVNDDLTVAGTYPRIRANGSTHVGGMKAGKVLYTVSGDPSSGVLGPADPDDAQIWLVRKDYKTADLTRDAATFHAIPAEEVTGAQIQESYDGYEYDWLNWPADQGAPFDDVDGNGVYDPAVDIPGYPDADQTMWTVANDLPRADGTQVATDSYGSPSTGIELQITIWAYAFAADNPLGNMLFKRFRMIYTGLPGVSSWAKLDTVYFVNWSDPDLGDASDDYVGCDTLLSLGYVYNANTLDGVYWGDYGMPVAAGGYDFLQGPISAEGDTLGLTSFTYFGAGSAISDPTQYEYEGTLQYFNLMEGFLPDPMWPAQEPFTDPFTNEATKFVLSGDPVTGEGWVDGFTLPPGDRRLVMSTGPFEMALGDTQDIVVALIGAQGGDNLSSVTVLKYYDLFAQYAYDNNFVLPSPPSKPKVEAFGGDDFISLYWAHDEAAVAATEEIVQAGFQFEGYNIYQLPSAAATPAEGVKIATYDLPNGITTILEKQVDPATGQVLDFPAQTGTDVEFKRNIVINKDRLRNRPISNDIPYFFGISAYSFLPGAAEIGSPFQSLESGMTVVSVFPQQPDPGVSYGAEAGDVLTMDEAEITHTSTGALSDGVVRVNIIDPSASMGHDYKVTFALDEDTASATYGEILWNLVDVTTGVTVLADQPQATDIDLDQTQPIIDGLQVKVAGPAAGIKSIQEIDYGGTTLDAPDNVWHSLNSNYTYYIGAGGGAGGIDRLERYAQYAAPRDFEMRFTDGPNYGVSGLSTDNIMSVPFELWDIGIATPDDLSDDKRMIPFIYENVARDTFGYDGDTDAYFGFTASDWIYWMDPEGVDGYSNFAAAAEGAGGPGNAYPFDTDGSTDGYWVDFHGDFVYPIGRLIIGDYDLGGQGVPSGTTIRIVTRKPITTDDVFTFTAPAITQAELTQADIDRINVFPNPYYGYQVLERARAAKWMRFNHLPTDREVTIRIFNLGGIMVRTIVKPATDGTQYAEWNLLNQAGYPVASGIYIAYIEVDGVDKTKILKLAIVQEVQILDVY